MRCGGFLSFVGIGVLLLSGCANQAVVPKKEAGLSPFQKAILNSADSINQQLSMLSAVQQARFPEAKIINDEYSKAPLSGALNKRVKFRWNGPIDPAVKELARLAGWSFSVQGLEPIEPVLIAVNSKDETIFSVLHQIGDQTGESATVKVDGIAHIITVQYPVLASGIHDAGSAIRHKKPVRR